MNDLLQLPSYPLSRTLQGMSFDGVERVLVTGDMWPLTWADDDNIYAAAGDNSGYSTHFQTMNFWKVEGDPPNHDITLVNDLSFLEPDGWDSRVEIPPIKPAGVVAVDGVLYLAVEDMRYSEGRYGNQINLQGWIIHSTDYGVTWSAQPRPGTMERRFLGGVFASPHFLQFGKDYSDARDQYVYAYSCAGDDGIAAWSAGDHTYLARVPRDALLDRKAWEFFSGESALDVRWSRRMEDAAPVFSYRKKTGENEVVYHPGFGRYLLLNWSFIDCTNHHFGSLHSELSIYEAPEPWGPWATVFVERDWGRNCDYQPRLPTKWINPRGNTAWLVSAGNFWQKGGRDHYGFVTVPLRFNTGNFGVVGAANADPCAINDFEVFALSDTEVELRWAPVQGVGFYRIERDGRKLRDIGPCYPAKHIDTDLVPDSGHDYRVIAYRPSGDEMRTSEYVETTTLPECTTPSIGVNLAGAGVLEGDRHWFGEDSTTRFSVVAAGCYEDQRILDLPLSPAPGPQAPLLRGFRGELPGVKIVFNGVPESKVHVWVHVVDLHLSRSTVEFELTIQRTITDTVSTSADDDSNWRVIGPYEVPVDGSGKVLVEGKNFRGLGGVAAVRVERIE